MSARPGLAPSLLQTPERMRRERAERDLVERAIAARDETIILVLALVSTAIIFAVLGAVVAIWAVL